MSDRHKARMAGVVMALGLASGAVSSAAAASRIEGQVRGGGGPVAHSTVTLWAGSTGDPRQLAQTKTRRMTGLFAER
jgi:hypothetical protein